MKTVTYRRHARRSLLALLSAVVVLFTSALDVAHAQAGVTLTVQLRDVVAQPVAGSTVRVIDVANGRVLAEEITSASGSAAFWALRPGAVRITVAGTLPDGTALRQIGLDTNGIVVAMPQAPWTMALQVDGDGTVVPDLSLDGAGAADGADHAAIQAGTFGHPATPTPERPRLAPTAPTGTALHPAATGGTTAGEGALALGWLAVLGVALGLIIVYGRRL